MCPKQLVGVDKDKKATEIIIRFIDLPDDQFRLGNTKVYHRQYTCVNHRAQLMHDTNLLFHHILSCT